MPFKMQKKYYFPEKNIMLFSRKKNCVPTLPKIVRLFLLFDLLEFFFGFRVVGTKKKINKKALKMTS